MPGVLPHICLDHGMTMSMYYQDPDGNGVEIQVDMFDDWAVSKEWMWASQEFGEDQIGAPVRPEKVLAATAASGVDAGADPQRAHARASSRPDSRVPTLTFPDPWPGKLAADPSLADGVPLPPMPRP